MDCDNEDQDVKIIHAKIKYIRTVLGYARLITDTEFDPSDFSQDSLEVIHVGNTIIVTAYKGLGYTDHDPIAGSNAHSSSWVKTQTEMYRKAVDILKRAGITAEVKRSVSPNTIESIVIEA